MCCHNKKRAVVWLLVLIISGCSSVPVGPEVEYSEKLRAQLQDLQDWSFEGRMGLVAKNDSWQANIDWKHHLNAEEIRLAGPLGQGATLIQLSGNMVKIDRGGDKVQTSTQPEAFISQQLGVFVPISSLRYWVIGLPEPTSAFIEMTAGFKQSGWLIEYKQMQRIDDHVVPRKIIVSNERAKLKLMIDQWDLNVAKTK